jgi:predicted DsbA family dithiol-disulfide isomerase
MKNIIKTILTITMISQMSFLSISALAEEPKPTDKIKIDIISDVVCPWCAIGYKRLSVAISELKLEDQVEISWHPFELNPEMPREGENADKYLMNKYDLSEEKLKLTRNNVTELGKETGFKFDYFKEMKKVNTFNAHILLAYAKEFNKQTELKVRLQNAYFGERKDVSNREVLEEELKAVGLNAKEAMKRLDDPKAIKAVEDEEKFWRDQGVYAIPTMIFDNKIAQMGANETETYKEILLELTKKN